MDARRAPIHNAKTAPLSKAKGVSSLKTKVDSALRAGSNSSTGKSTGKDLQPKIENNVNPPTEEVKLDLVDGPYNSYITSTAMKILLEKSKVKSKADIDKQIATLQKRVSDNLNVLEETKTKVSTLYLIEDQKNLLLHHSAACQLCSDESSFTEGKNYEELMCEIDRVKNQLPCKCVHVPEINAEMANFQAATTQLLNSLERISTVYGVDQSPTMDTATELQKIHNVKASLEGGKQGIEAISSLASASILSNTGFKTSPLSSTNQ